jgi:hypothetical protein
MWAMVKIARVISHSFSLVVDIHSVSQDLFIRKYMRARLGDHSALGSTPCCLRKASDELDIGCSRVIQPNPFPSSCSGNRRGGVDLQAAI